MLIDCKKTRLRSQALEWCRVRHEAQGRATARVAVRRALVHPTQNADLALLRGETLACYPPPSGRKF